MAIKKYDVDYNKLKVNIRKACRHHKGELFFIVNYEKLSNLANTMGLSLLNTGLRSRRITGIDIGFISEYLKNEKLEWIDGNKQFTVLTFLQTSSIDEKCKQDLALIEGYESERIDCTRIDKANLLAKIIANYPCVSCLVVGYISADPNRYGKVSYNITCRMNNIFIRGQLSEAYAPDDDDWEDGDDDNTDKPCHPSKPSKPHHCNCGCDDGIEDENGTVDKDHTVNSHSIYGNQIVD